MAIIESGGKSYNVYETQEQVQEALRSFFGGEGINPYLELALVDGGSIFVAPSGASLAVTETPAPGRSVGFGGS